jgi:hypothetical protein
MGKGNWRWVVLDAGRIIAEALSAVMPRLVRGIQYSAAVGTQDRTRGLSSRAMTVHLLLHQKIKKRAEARCFVKSPDLAGCPGGAKTPPGLEDYFLAFLAFFVFFAFFAFFAFLAIASSFGLMGGNATRGLLGGGPTSQHPRKQSQQIRSPLPRAVT